MNKYGSKLLPGEIIDLGAHIVADDATYANAIDVQAQMREHEGKVCPVCAGPINAKHVWSYREHVLCDFECYETMQARRMR